MYYGAPAATASDGREVGATRALLARYGTIERIPSDEALWEVGVRGAAGLARELRQRREEALLYRRLTTLRRDVPLAESLEQLAWKGVNRTALLGIRAELDLPPVST